MHSQPLAMLTHHNVLTIHVNTTNEVFFAPNLSIKKLPFINSPVNHWFHRGLKKILASPIRLSGYFFNRCKIKSWCPVL